MDLAAIQHALVEEKLDGWLFYDHHRRDAIAYRVLGIAPALCTRRWYYLVPAAGEPAQLVHRIESHNLRGLPGTKIEYSTYTEQRERLRATLAGRKRIAMQYSAFNDIPYIGLVDAGTIELVKSFGVEVVSSADLVQMFEARWSPEALASHLEAGKIIHEAVRAGFAAIHRSIVADQRVTEYDIQQLMVRTMEDNGVSAADDPPLVAVNSNCSDPHYSPGPDSSRPILAGDFVLLDVFGKLKQPGAVFYDITWTGFVGEEVPARYQEIFAIVQDARNSSIDLIQNSLAEDRPLRGCDVDDAARRVIERAGYGQYFVHRTGHSLGEDIHGNGANMDNFETRDVRRVIPRTCFSVEPGIYLPEFGVRSEVNVYVEEQGARVTGEIQSEVVPILATPIAG